MKGKYILALDQGTTSSRAILFDHDRIIISIAQKAFEQIFPQPGWVEHDPLEIWSSQAGVAAEAVAKAGKSGLDIAAIGITNQRETTIVWDRETGEPVYNAIVWQDRRTAGDCDTLRQQGWTEKIREKTGLVIDAYFSATKVKWILDHVPGMRKKAEQGELCFGTVDSWLVWKFTRGKVHVTDLSNACRTMLFNIHSLEWDPGLLDLFGIPASMLPEVRQSSEVYCETATTLFASKIPIAGIAGDQQAALFGQQCTQQGMVKNTYGTGCFMMMNTGERAVSSSNNLLTTIAWKINGKTSYALEGSVFIAGAAIQWLRDGLGIIRESSQVEELAREVSDNGGVFFVPALTGLGAPWWDPYARGTIVGITRGTTRGHLARATLEAIACQSYDVLKAMEADICRCRDERPIIPTTTELRVDGGAVANNLLMQYQADLSQVVVVRPHILETTAMGAAFLAGLATGFWKNTDDLAHSWKEDRRFIPEIEKEKSDFLIYQWHRAVERSRSWSG
jgi:glycerol kinase